MYTCKIKTLTEEEKFSTLPVTDVRNDDVVERRKISQHQSPPDGASSNPEMGCSVCKQLQEALNKHLKRHHGGVVLPVKQAQNEFPFRDRESIDPKTPKAQNREGTSQEAIEITEIRNQTEKPVLKKKKFEENANRGSSAEEIDKTKIEGEVGKPVSDKIHKCSRLQNFEPEKSNKKGERKQPKMKQLTLLTATQNLKKRKPIGLKIQEPLIESGYNQRMPKSTVKTSTLSETPTPEMAPILETLKKEKCDNIQVNKSNNKHATKWTVTTTTATEKPTLQTPPNLEPFKNEKCDFVTVVDSFGRYPCLWCKKSFATQHNLSRHVLKHKDNKNKQRFACAECGKPFDRKDSLKRHYLSHKNERPNVCHICKRRFKQKGHLQVHLKQDRCFKRDRLSYY